MTCRITNTGRGPARKSSSSTTPPVQPGRPPPRELKAFTKIGLEPGETETVTFHLGARDLSYWSTSLGDWVVEPGEYSIQVGASSRDIRLTTTVFVDAPRRRAPLTASSTLQEWRDDPITGPELLRTVGVTEDGAPLGILGDEELMKVLGNFPLRTLTAFTGLGITEDVLSHMTASFAASGTD